MRVCVFGVSGSDFVVVAGILWCIDCSWYCDKDSALVTILLMVIVGNISEGYGPPLPCYILVVNYCLYSVYVFNMYDKSTSNSSYQFAYIYIWNSLFQRLISLTVHT